MTTIEDIEKRIKAIELRNSRVEIDKAWESSLTRKILVMLLTYMTIGIYMNAIHVESPLLNAIIPTLGFMLSTLTLPIFKKIWIKYQKNV